MRKAFTIIILIGITFFGCSDNFDDNLVSTPVQTDQLTKSAYPENLNSTTRLDEFPKSLDSEALFHSTLSRDNYESEEGNDPLVNPQIVVSQTINGITGGVLEFDTTYVNYQGRQLYVYTRIFVQDSTFQGDTEFTVKLNPEEATIELFPHMVFNRVVRVSAWFEGIDLAYLGYTTTDHADFAFFGDDGTIEFITAQQSHINIDQSTIKVLNAQLSHFSRYGWVR